jgi:hypothetical protein
MAANRCPKTGRFLPGNNASPGRKPRATEEEYAQVFKDVIPIERWERMIEKQALRAEQKGDLVAFKALVSYLAGAPIQKQQLTGKDGENLVINLSWGDDPDNDQLS